MKNLKYVISIILFIFAISCCNSESENEKPDESKYFDQDKDCAGSPGTCCDVDGRILVETGKSYKYTYKTNFITENVEWKVESGGIILISGQNTKEATFYFPEGFTKGVISAYGEKPNSLACENALTISKL